MTVIYRSEERPELFGSLRSALTFMDVLLCIRQVGHQPSHCTSPCASML